MNQVQLIGRLVRDPELRTSNSNGKSYCAFNLAVSSYSNGSEYTNYISCFAWERTAENLVKYQTKGSLIAVEGSINARSTKRDDGTYDNQTSVTASRIEFLGSKNDGNYIAKSQSEPSDNFQTATTGFDFDSVNSFKQTDEPKKDSESSKNDSSFDDSDSVLWD